MRSPHDLTKVVPAVSKARLSNAWHIITKDDIPELLSIGKEHIFDDGTGRRIKSTRKKRLYRIAKGNHGGKNLTNSAPSEGRVNLKATSPGCSRSMAPHWMK